VVGTQLIRFDAEHLHSRRRYGSAEFRTAGCGRSKQCFRSGTKGALSSRLVTLIINAVWGPWAFHASDRYVSIQATQRNPQGEWDPHSNKTVIVIGSDCWLVMGYSGLAYLNGRPTDQYLAECVSGIVDLSGGSMAPWNPPPGLHYREIRKRIATGLERAYANLPRKTRQTKTAVLAAAVQRKRNGITRPMFRIDMVGDAASCVELVPRFLPLDGYNLSAVGFRDSGTLNKLYDDLHSYRVSRAASSTPPNPEPFRDLMMQSVRETAAQVPDKVGQHVVGVILDPMEKKIRTVFSPGDPTGQPPLGHDVGERFGDLARIPTPFVLTPGWIYSPSVASSGGWVNPMTGITFEFSGFGSDDSGPGGGYFGSQPRTGQPR
jgi:hypothetical protein